MEVPLIEGRFFLYKQKHICKVELTANYLKYKSDSVSETNLVEEAICIQDIIGCVCMKSNSCTNTNNAYFTIYAYTLVGKKNTKRSRKSVTFEITNRDTFEGNLNTANEWRDILYSTLYSPTSCIKRKDGNYIQVPLYCAKKKILVFINPKSGPGLAYEIYKRKIKPVLLEAEIWHEVIVTSYSKHAYKIVQHKNLSLYAGIIVVAGDGLLYEVYNGLLQRSDRSTALSIPIGIIPGGSGNGLARSIAHHVNEPYITNPVLVSTLNITNPIPFPMDLVLVNTENGKNYVSFLSIGYGIMADIDIGSESLRAIGEARFTIYGLTRVLNLRKYRARLSYKMAENIPPYNHERSPNQVISDTVHPKFPKEQKQMGKSICWGSNENMNIFDISLQSGDHCDDISLQSESPDAVNKPLANDWITIEENFISIYAVSQPFIGSESMMSPRSKMNDGVMWLCYLKGNISKTSVFKFLISIDKGTHINMPDVHYIPVTGLRIEPLCSTGKITLDGELIEHGSIHAVVLPSKARVMTRIL